MKKNIRMAMRLRENSTEAEKMIWKHLRGRQLKGLKFRRQQPLGSYIVDFICFEKNIIIEIDGGQHVLQTAQDDRRDEWLKKQGFRVLRFWNNDVLANFEGVLEVIKSTI
jgi:very-short-patch-repair endonuclease